MRLNGTTPLPTASANDTNGHVKAGLVKEWYSLFGISPCHDTNKTLAVWVVSGVVVVPQLTHFGACSFVRENSSEP